MAADDVSDLWGATEAELLTALSAARKDLLAGSMIQSSGGGDVNASSLIQSNARSRIREIQRALYQLDPATYPDGWAFIGANVTVPTFSSNG